MAWLRQPVTREELVRDGRAPVMRFNLAERHLSRDEVIAYLEGFRREVARYLEELEESRERATAESTLHQRFSLEHGLRSYQQQLAWIEDAMAELRAEEARGEAGRVQGGGP